LAAHLVAQGQHHVEAVVRHLVVFAVSGSCSEKPNNWILLQFTIIKDVFDVQ
jgi:hypothetical protein